MKNKCEFCGKSVPQKCNGNCFGSMIQYTDKHMSCDYCADGSGSIAIFMDGEELFSAEDGGLKYQIEYVEDFIKEYKKKVKTMEKCLPKLKSLKKKYKL